MQHYSHLLDKLMSHVKNGQMQRYEYEHISNFLGDVNFLVFGTGYDTEFWRYCNAQGNTYFLEHDSNWVLDTSHDTFLINYSCNIKQSKRLLKEFKNSNTKNLEIDLPSEILNKNFDVILVDSPAGNKKNSIGRMQSIYMAYRMSNKNTNIFVHDCDREVEDSYTKSMFTVVEDLNKLRHCTL
jgi:hypothetical protein